jgi:sulfur relay (sulfurtransferase) complex TusBCD TusD component (DsrE family)
MKISFLIMTEFLKHQQTYTMLQMIKAAKAKNHDVHGVFFFGTSAISLRKDVKLGKATRNIPEAIGTLCKENIPVYVCQTWADNYGVLPEHVVEGVKVLGLGELSDMTYESNKLVVFGART